MDWIISLKTALSAENKRNITHDPSYINQITAWGSSLGLQYAKEVLHTTEIPYQPLFGTFWDSVPLVTKTLYSLYAQAALRLAILLHLPLEC